MKDIVAVAFLYVTLLLMCVAGMMYIDSGYTPQMGRVGMVAFITSVAGYLTLACGRKNGH